MSELVRRIHNLTAGDPIAVATGHMFVSVCGLVALFRRKQEERRQREGPVSEYDPNDGEIETE